MSMDARGGAVRGTRRFRRGEFLRIGGAGLAGAALLGSGALAGCGGGEEGGSGTVTYAEGPDDTGTLKKLLDGFNKKYKGKYTARHREMPADTQGYFDKLRTELQAGNSDIDVIAGDVIWPAQLASNGWLMDLSDRFTKGLQDKFIKGNVESNVYKGKIYGVPFVTGAGLIYYRKDLLEKSGFTSAPETWDELKQMALKVKQDSGTRFGFVFEGANYEGGVCDGLEYIWTHGGDVLKGDRVVIDSPEAAAGLATYHSMVSDGVTTEAMATYKEEEAQGAFLRGDAVFMRNWSYVYALTSDPAQSKIKPEQVGLSTLPVARKGMPLSSALGATNLFINSTSKNADGAWALIKYFTAPEQQKMRAIEGARLPVTKVSYEDQELLKKVPVMKLGKEALKTARPRPVSPYYSDMSLKMAEEFFNVLKGDTAPEQAVGRLQGELQSIIKQGKNA
ncbi:MAG TPA: ABC transporter substrate-binding protein [Rubrobacteraceae bacterium]|nr:ABC transporter substrate-binding protein [Rubrobacteraceae bacterium]